MEDSDIDEDEVGKLYLMSQNGTKLQRKHLCQFLVSKINSINGIRKLYRIFTEERRKILTSENPSQTVSDDYFSVCKKYIPLLEILRKANLAQVY